MFINVIILNILMKIICWLDIVVLFKVNEEKKENEIFVDES